MVEEEDFLSLNTFLNTYADLLPLIKCLNGEAWEEGQRATRCSYPSLQTCQHMGADASSSLFVYFAMVTSGRADLPGKKPSSG